MKGSPFLFLFFVLSFCEAGETQQSLQNGTQGLEEFLSSIGKFHFFKKEIQCSQSQNVINISISYNQYFLCPAALKKVLSDPSEHEIRQNSTLTTIPALGVEWSVAFKIKPTSFVKDRYANCLNMIEESGSRREIGKILLPPNHWLQADFRYAKGPQKSISDDSLLPLRNWTQIEIAQVKVGETTNIVLFRNGLLVGKIENAQPENVFRVNVFATKQYVSFQPGMIKELTIRTDLSGIQNLQNRSLMYQISYPKDP